MSASGDITLCAEPVLAPVMLTPSGERPMKVRMAGRRMETATPTPTATPPTDAPISQVLAVVEDVVKT